MFSSAKNDVRRFFWGAAVTGGLFSFVALLLSGAEILFPDIRLFSVAIDSTVGITLALARFGIGAAALFTCLLVVNGTCALVAGCASRSNNPLVIRLSHESTYDQIPASIQFVRSLREMKRASELVGVN